MYIYETTYIYIYIQYDRYKLKINEKSPPYTGSLSFPDYSNIPIKNNNNSNKKIKHFVLHNACSLAKSINFMVS